MIVVKLIGGLGNQMFQYAAGRSLANFHKTELFVDVLDLERDPGGAYTPRNYELEKFKIQAGKADEKVLAHFNFNASRWKRKLQSFFPALSAHLVFNESSTTFHSQFYKLPAFTYLNGYWQNEKYFAGIREELISEFELKEPGSLAYTEFLGTIVSSESVSVHVRRGDYVSLKSANLYHGVLPKEYYQKALSYFTDQQKDFRFFVFSDDLEWCKENLGFIKNCTFVNGVQLGFSAQEEMLLMRRCKHNIIANSSFSWWATWLNTYSNKMVVAPAQWFSSGQKQPTELLPKNWIKI